MGGAAPGALGKKLAEAQFNRAKKTRWVLGSVASLAAAVVYGVIYLDLMEGGWWRAAESNPQPPGVTTAEAAPPTANPAQAEQGAATDSDPGAFRARFMEQLARYEDQVEPQIATIRLRHWAGDVHAELVGLKARALEHFSRGDYLEARRELGRARALAADAAAQYAGRLEAAKRDARQAFANERAPEAEQAVRRALHLNPADPDMLALEKRVAVMPRALEALARAAVARNENRPRKEAAALREALAVDPARGAAEARLGEVLAHLARQRFADAVQGARRALRAEDLDAAERQAALAKTIFPADRDLAVLQKRLARARTEQAFAAQLALGRRAGARDDWAAAQTHFARALELKPGHQTAVESHDFARRIADADREIRLRLKHERRLGDARVLDSVGAYLRQTAPLVEVSPGLGEVHAALAGKVAAYRAEVEVVVVSDNKTYITVRGQGRVGKTLRRTIRLRPGKRVFEGVRPGYQSRLVTVDLRPGAPPVEVVVVCDEKI